jgi:hypothetical protein
MAAHCLNKKIAQEAARREMQAAVAHLAKARQTECGAVWILSCARALRVAEQRLKEASAYVAETQQPVHRRKAPA